MFLRTPTVHARLWGKHTHHTHTLSQNNVYMTCGLFCPSPWPHTLTHTLAPYTAPKYDCVPKRHLTVDSFITVLLLLITR